MPSRFSLRVPGLSGGVPVPLVLLLLGIVAGATMRVLPRLEVHDAQRLGQAVVLVLVGLGAVWRAVRGRAAAPSLLPRRAWIALGLAATLGLISALRAPLPRYGLLDVAYHGLLLVALVEGAAAVRRQPEGSARLVVYGLAGLVVLMLFGVAVSYLMHVAGLGTPLFPRAGYVFSHVRFFNQVQVWTLPLLALPLLWARGRGLRAAGFVLLALWWALLIASGGRGALLGIAAGLGAAAWLHGRAAWAFLKAQAASALAGAGLFYLLFHVLARSSGTLVDRAGAGDSGRLQLWSAALEMARTHPLLGVGPMHYAYRPVLERTAHPHNEVLRLLAEWGVPATLLVLTLLLWAAWSWMRHVRRKEAATPDEWLAGLMPALTATLVGAGLLALVDGVLVMPVSQLLAVLVGSLALGIVRAGQEPPGDLPPARLAQRGWALGAATCVGLSLACLLPDAGRLPERQRALMRHFEEQRDRPVYLAPRFWQIGFIEEWTEGAAQSGR